MKPIPGTLVRTPWGGDQAAQVLVDFYELDGTPPDLDPRHALGRVVDRFTADGLTPVLAVELEFYLVDPRRARDGSIRPARPGYSRSAPRNVEVYGLRDLETFRPFFDALYAATDVQDLPHDSALSDFAPAHYEPTLRHNNRTAVA